MASPADVFGSLPPRPADKVGDAAAPKGAASGELEPDQSTSRVRHSDRGPKPSGRGASDRELATVRGEITRLRQAVDHLPSLDQFSDMLDARLRALHDKLDQILDRLNGSAAVPAPAITEPEPIFADPARVPPLDREQCSRAVEVWSRRLIRNPNTVIQDHATAVLAALAGDDPPSLDLRRAVAAASVFTYACHLSGAYPDKMAAEDVERLDREIYQAVPDVTLLTETEYDYFLDRGIKERL